MSSTTGTRTSLEALCADLDRAVRTSATDAEAVDAVSDALRPYLGRTDLLVPGLVFFSALAMVACLVSLPLLAIELANGAFVLEAPKGWLILLYVAIGPSILSQLFFMRAVELIGPGRAGVFVNLVPVFAPILAVLILGEQLALYHGLALLLVLGGIFIAERLAKRV